MPLLPRASLGGCDLRKAAGGSSDVGTLGIAMDEQGAAAALLHGDEEVIYVKAGYQGIAKRPAIADKIMKPRVVMRPSRCRVLPDTPEGRLVDLAETTKPHIRSKVEHPFRVT